MPIFFQQQINETTRLGIWKIEEEEDFFKITIPRHRQVTHPHKRLQHLAGRFLLQYLFPSFPYELIQIADTQKPFIPDEQFHFSISHCGNFAAAIVSRKHRVGIDIEIAVEKILRIQNRFLTAEEKNIWAKQLAAHPVHCSTLLWSAKEAVFKWYGAGGVDFREHIQLLGQKEEISAMDCFFTKTSQSLLVNYRWFDQLILNWVLS